MSAPPTPPPASPELKEMVEELVRTYVFRVMRRYVPFIVGLVTLAIIVALVPTVSPSDSNGFTNASSGAANGRRGATAGVAALDNAGAAPDAATADAAGAIGDSTGASVVANPSAHAPAAAKVTVDCSRRQVTWSHNGPCFTTFASNNGGATAPGVTDKQIVASFRLSTAGEAAAIEALAAGDNQVQSQVLSDLQVFVNYFNSQFQLYGRKVVLKNFTGQGDWLQEYQGQDLAAAQADAATAKGLGAFIDLSPPATTSSPPYCSDLAHERIICAGGVVETNHYMSQYYPYVMSPTATLDYVENYWASMACQRMANLPAIFAGDALMQKSTRKFGIIALEEPDYDRVVNDTEAKMNACGAKVVRKINYPIDVATLETQDQNIIAQMKAAGATTILCYCDTLSPTLLTQAAETQQYHPEWMTINDGDGYGQQRRPSEWAHALMTVGSQPRLQDTEAYKVFKRASPNAEPAERPIWFVTTYYTALVAFATLQQAGPNLNAVNYMNGLFSLPPSLPGAKADGLPWGPGKGVFAPLDQAPIGYWSTTAPSPSNGKAGTTLSCGGADGDWHPIQRYDPGAYGTAHTQLHCFGT